MSSTRKKTTRYRITRTRKHLPVPGVWNTISEADDGTKKVHGINFRYVWLHEHHGNYTQIYLDSEWRVVCEFVAKKIIEDKSYLPYVYKNQYKTGNDLVKLSKKIIKQDLAQSSVPGLLRLYEAVQRLWIKYDQFCTLSWYNGAEGLRDFLQEKLKRAGVSPEEFIILTTPPEMTFSSSEELDLLKLTLKTKRYTEKLLVDKYYWIPFGYDGSELYDEAHYREAAKQLSKLGRRKLLERVKQITSYETRILKAQNRLRTKYGIDKKFWTLIRGLQILATMTDQRKEFTFQAHVALWKIFQELGQKLKIGPMLLKFVLLDEIKNNLHNLKKLKRLALDRKNKLIIFEGHNNKLRIIEGSEAKKLDSAMMLKSDGAVEVKGLVASLGPKRIVKGIARVLFGARTIKSVKDGEVLITSMTSPEFVPGMRKASAIVTDEGGVTSHAAIISRELNKLSVIGTKSATKIFKSGDMVEVDADKGVVRKI